MKRLALIAMLLLTAPVAEARQVTTDLLVVHLKTQKAADLVQGKSDIEQGNWVKENVLRVLDEWRVDYRVYDAAALPTGKMEWLRTGRAVVGPDTITASAVLHTRSSRRVAGLDNVQYRPDSLWMARVVNGTPMLPSVPSMFLLEAGPSAAYNAAATIAWSRSTACTTGASGNNTAIVGGSGVAHECEGCFYTPRETRVYFSSTGMTVAELDNSTRGGILPLVANYSNPMPKALQELGRMPADIMKARTWDGVTDTTGFYGTEGVPFRRSTPDTAAVWKRLNIGWNVHDHSGSVVPAAQMVFVNAINQIGTDGVGSSREAGAFEMSAVFMGLAALDSLTSGGIFNRTKTMAVTIDGAFARCSQWESKGVYLPDSAAVKATIDSLAAYGIPYLVGVNVDSVAAYPYEKAWWTRGQARFTPQVWSGVNGANGAASYVAGRYTLRDLFGHARARQAYGPADGAANDTSFYSQLKFAFARTDSLFPGRSSRFLLPPLDDMIPTNGNGDSIIIAASLAGASGIRIAAMDTLRRDYQVTNVQRYFGKLLKLLGHTGEYVTGGSRLLSVPGGTSFGGSGYFVEDSGYQYHPYCLLFERSASTLMRGTWHGYLQRSADGHAAESQFLAKGSSANPNTYDADGTIPAGGPDPNMYHNMWSLAGRACIMKVAASTLGGSTYIADLKQPGAWGETGNPTRPGWWAIRATDGFRAVVNAIAGRTLIRWGYPEDIEP